MRLTADRVSEFLPLLRSIHGSAWPDIPFIEADARESVIAHIESETATVFAIDEGERKAILMLDTAPLLGSYDTSIIVETAWGSTDPAPANSAARLLYEAKRWASAIGSAHMQINLGGKRKGAARFIQKLGGEVAHTAGIWRL